MHTITQIFYLFTCTEASCTELRRIQRLIGFEQLLQEPDIDVVPLVSTRCHYSAEPPALLVHLTLPQSCPPE